MLMLGLQAVRRQTSPFACPQSGRIGVRGGQAERLTPRQTASPDRDGVKRLAGFSGTVVHCEPLGGGVRHTGRELSTGFPNKLQESRPDGCKID